MCISFKAGCSPTGLTGEQHSEGQRRGEKRPAPDYVWLPQRQEKCKLGQVSTVLIGSELEMGTMRCYHPVEAALTERTFKTRMSQRHHAHQTTAMPAHNKLH